MGFIVLLAVGGVLAWVASILARGDDGRSIALYVAVGIAAALLFGAIASGESLMVGLSAPALLAGMTGATVSLAALTWARTRAAG